MLRTIIAALVSTLLFTASAAAQSDGSRSETGAGETVGAPGTENSGGSGSGMSSSGGTNTGSSSEATRPNELSGDATKLTYCPKPHGSPTGGQC